MAYKLRLLHLIRQLYPIFNIVKLSICYESPKQEKVSYAFEHLIQNLKAYNRVRI